jgi:CBS domain-containing protein
MAAIESNSLTGAPYDEVPVSDVMHPGVVICAPESPVAYAAKLMAHHRIHAIVVMGDDEEGGLWGVISDTDVLSAFARPELVASNAGALAQTPIVTVSPSDGVARAAELMRTHRVSHLLVTVRNRPIGVVSTLDLARAMAAGVGTDSRAGNAADTRARERGW